MPNSNNRTLVPSPDRGLARLIPRSAFMSALAGLVFSLPMGVVATAFAVYGFELYGAVLFCILPFSIGLGSDVRLS